MNLPQWVQKEIELLPAEFTGQIVIIAYGDEDGPHCPESGRDEGLGLFLMGMLSVRL